MQDRRQHERFKVVARGIKGKMILAKDVEIVDISICGILAKTDKRLYPSSEHIIKLNHKDKVISVKSIVIWSLLSGLQKNLRGELIPMYTAGMEFKRVSKETIDEIANFIKEHKKDKDKMVDIYMNNGSGLYTRFDKVTPEKAALDLDESCKVKHLSLGDMLTKSVHAHRVAEKRRHKRFIKRFETELRADDTIHRKICSNLSLNGLFIITSRPFPLDTLLDIVIHFPNGLTSKLKGRVIRKLKKPAGRVIRTPLKSFKNGIGIEIIEKDDNYLEVIKSSFA